MTDTAIGVGGERATWLGRLLAWRRQWLAIDKNDRALTFAMTPAGMAAMHAALLACLFVCRVPTIALAITAVALPLIALFPTRKLAIIALSTVAGLLLWPMRTGGSQSLPQHLVERYGVTWIDPQAAVTGMVVLFVALAWLALGLQARYRQSAAARRPVMASMAVFALLIGLVLTDLLPPAGRILLWTFVAIFASSFWVLAYALNDQRTDEGTPRWQRLGLFRPLWGGSPTPCGKGVNYLRKFEAKTDVALAAVRLRAVKLAVWAALLSLFSKALRIVLHDVVGIPSLLDSLAATASGGPPMLATGWAIVISNYFISILSLCVYGHAIVATIRMAGYGIPRNSARPLSARTLAEFWNRYYFYFKELLVDFFFYPAFLRWFKSRPKLRIAFATFCAAALGNFIYHFMREIDLVAREGLPSALFHFQSYALYCLLLASGLILSQLRGKRPKAEDGFLKYQVLPRLNVGLFFCLLAVLGDGEGVGTLAVRLEFLFSLFGA